MIVIQANSNYTDQERTDRYKIINELLQCVETHIMSAMELFNSGRLMLSDRTLPALKAEMRRDRNAMIGTWEYKKLWTDANYLHAINSRRKLMVQAGIKLNGPTVLTREQICIPRCPTEKQIRNPDKYNETIKQYHESDLLIPYVVTKISTYGQLQWIGTHETLVDDRFKTSRTYKLFIMYRNDQQYFSGIVPGWIRDIYTKTRAYHNISYPHP